MAGRAAAQAELALLRNADGAVLGSVEGHFIRNHIGQTAEDLAKRLAFEPGKKVVSSFTSQEVAAAALQDALSLCVNQAAVKAVFSSSAGTSARISVTLPNAVGTILESSGSAYFGNTATFVIMKNPYTMPHSLFIVTGWVSK
jgi:Bacterial CdiA-CT RNAse A domain